MTTGIAPILVEPRLAIKNRTPLTHPEVEKYSYITTLVKVEKNFLVCLSLSRNDGTEKAVIRDAIIPENHEKLANDSMLNILKSLPSKEIDVLSFDKKPITEKEFKDILIKWTAETATKP